jgi:hypothetical protein
MSLNLTSPVTGGAQTGLTTPTYTLTADTAPTNTGKQYAVTGLGGTQTGVDTTSSPSRPFTFTGSRPAVLRQAPAINQVTGLISNVPNNTYKLVCRKGVTVITGQSPRVASVQCEINIPAGAEIVDPANVRAMLSLFVGALNQFSASLGDTVVSGVI